MADADQSGAYRGGMFAPCPAHDDGRHRFVDADVLPPNVTVLRACSCGSSLGVSTRTDSSSIVTNAGARIRADALTDNAPS